ncbi:MAG: hypothetical protein KJO21_10280 [Verrucomicrobiae bacterium]|nr:hypothetical protein [Verrucomicrobiae bacterium]NNJ42321.1 hypothetical protein [Akkermansiaceae bacterium]
MSDAKLFRIQNGTVEQFSNSTVAVEKLRQDQLEKDLETFLGILFLASDHSTGTVHGGCIDTLGIDENGCSVIVEYKRATNENVINQDLPPWGPSANRGRKAPEGGFSRDVSAIGHFGTGDLQLAIRSSAELQKPLPLSQPPYERN